MLRVSLVEPLTGFQETDQLPESRGRHLHRHQTIYALPHKPSSFDGQIIHQIQTGLQTCQIPQKTGLKTRQKAKKTGLKTVGTIFITPKIHPILTDTNL